MGLREDKKQRTRRHIAETAWALFADRGFDGVTVAQIADAALVAEATVFNYFAGKEDLFFDGLDQYGHELVAGVAARPPGESVVAAFRRLLTTPGGLLGQLEDGDPRALDRLRTVNRIIAGSPVLQARELVSLARIAEELAGQLGDDRFTARVVAHTLLGVHRALVLLVRESVLAGEVPPVAEYAAKAFDLIERGLDG